MSGGSSAISLAMSPPQMGGEVGRLVSTGYLADQKQK